MRLHRIKPTMRWPGGKVLADRPINRAEVAIAALKEIARKDRGLGPWGNTVDIALDLQKIALKALRYLGEV